MSFRRKSQDLYLDSIIYLASKKKGMLRKLRTTLVHLREGLEKEGYETREMFSIYLRYSQGNATKLEMKNANKQFREVAKGLGVGVILVLPFAPLTLPLVVKLGEKLGVDIDNLLISQPDNGEQALEITENLIRSGAIDIIVIDSVAALTPRAEIEGEMGDSKMGLHARLMSQALRKLTGSISKTKCTVIFINQLREKIGVMFGNPETTTGGNALKFYASVRLDIRRSTQIKDSSGSVLGNKTRVKVVKNKVAPPFKLAEFDIMYGEGVSKVGEILDIAVEHEVVKKSGSWFSYGETKLGQGRDAVKSIIKDNPELMDELEEKIKAIIKNAE